MDKLKKLIAFIRAEYAKVNADAKVETNLKKTYVEAIETGGAIYESVMGYVGILREYYDNNPLQLPSDVTCRVKAQNSVEYKIQNYKTEQHNFGKSPINKCLNDLQGFRIIVDTPITLEQVQSLCEGDERCIDSTKLEYKAIHMYFREGNYKFPWELQIWNRCDAENNFASHKKYKQGYTVWEKMSKEGGFIDG